MNDTIKAPMKNPCGSCPYRCDSPSGLWSRDHYELLPEFDKPTHEQPMNPFGCHQNNGHLCAGWVATHDMEQSLGLRTWLSFKQITIEVVDACLNYSTTVPLFKSGQEAMEHGLREFAEPSERTKKIAAKLVKRGAVYGEAFEEGE